MLHLVRFLSSPNYSPFLLCFSLNGCVLVLHCFCFVLHVFVYFGSNSDGFSGLCCDLNEFGVLTGLEILELSWGFKVLVIGAGAFMEIDVSPVGTVCTEMGCKRKRKHNGSCSRAGTKACREKMWREKMNDRHCDCILVLLNESVENGSDWSESLEARNGLRLGRLDCMCIGAMESVQVMSVKALGTSLKLTFEGNNQLIYPETWFFMLVVATCVITQMNYPNKGLGVRVGGLAVRGWCFVISCCTFVPCCALFTAHQVLCCASVLCSGVGAFSVLFCLHAPVLFCFVLSLF
ncbi:hypothetical protein L1049_016855 [Liquidambar formosana]|uniref:Probable magnesium transporter n=1 Tax=Liquidambar formosana TaxID=63359 RepID=A0AAP0X0W1_LIQFO